MAKEKHTCAARRNRSSAPLRRKAKQVTDFSSTEVSDCVRDLNDALDSILPEDGSAPEAAALSAPRIGYDLAVSAVQLGGERYVLIDPEVMREDGKDRLFCLCCPGLHGRMAMVRYNDNITVRYKDPSGAVRDLRLTGETACAVRLELDHLEGITLSRRAAMSGNRLFVPRAASGTDGRVPLIYRGPVAELRRRLGLACVRTAPEHHSAVFSDRTDLSSYTEKEAQKEKDLLQKVNGGLRKGSSVLEVGCGIGALSAVLALSGYRVSCAQTDPDMAFAAARVLQSAGAKAEVFFSAAEELSGTYDAAVSCGLLETLDGAAFIRVMEHLSSLTGRLFISLPTIWGTTEDMRGCERLRTVDGWKKQIRLSGWEIEDTFVAGYGEKAVFTLKRKGRTI